MADNKEALAGESMLSRWSRRKLESEQPAVAGDALPEQEASAPGSAQPDSEAAEARPLTDADMPDIETLTEDSDFSGFMSAGVSDELRNLALRKLFRASVFNLRDGLDEYDEDYTSFEKLGDIVTSDMKHQIAVQERKRLEALAQDEAGADAVQEADDLDAVEDVEDIEDADDVETVAAAESLEATATPVADQVTMKTNKPSDIEHG